MLRLHFSVGYRGRLRNVTRFQGIDHVQTDLPGMTCFWVTEVILDIMSYTAYDEERREINLRRFLQSVLATYVVFVLARAKLHDLRVEHSLIQI